MMAPSFQNGTAGHSVRSLPFEVHVGAPCTAVSLRQTTHPLHSLDMSNDLLKQNVRGGRMRPAARAARRFGRAAILVFIAACDLGGPADCSVDDGIIHAAITVHVFDSLTAEPIAGVYPVVAREGVYADTAEIDLFPPPEDNDTIYHGPFQMAFERAGTYEVEVSPPGYRKWIQTGVEVAQEECHVDGSILNARMVH